MISKSDKIAKQIAHVKQHEAALLARVGGYRNTEAYFRAHVGAHPDLYDRICLHLDITPKPELETKGTK